MDACTSALGNKTQKLIGGHNASQNKDVISRLPDHILVRILSFLSTEEAIKSSTLSKRWKYLWVSMPNFSFSDFSVHCSRPNRYDQVLELGDGVLDSIDRALFLRNDSCLENFKLWLDKHVDASRLHSWVSAAVKHKVQKFDLSLPDREEFVLPTSLFTCKSLSYFSLHMRCTLKIPSYVCFSGLKHLNLGDVKFQDDQSAQQLFSGFPVLEDLSLYNCHWENIKEITIEIPALRVLTFADRILPYHFLNGKIIISALNLETLYVSGSLTVELLPSNLGCLKSAKIDINNSFDAGQERSWRIVNLLSGLHNIESLHVTNATLEPLHFAENPEGRLPTFYNLTSLYNFVGCTPLFVVEYTTGALVYILKKSPNLGTLYLPGAFKPRELHMMLEIVSHCFQSSLKDFTIFCVHGTEQDLCLLKHVKENALCLECLTVDCSPKLSEDLEKQEEIRQQLQQLHGGSENCKIQLLPYVNPMEL